MSTPGSPSLLPSLLARRAPNPAARRCRGLCGSGTPRSTHAPCPSPHNADLLTKHQLRNLLFQDAALPI